MRGGGISNVAGSEPRREGTGQPCPRFCWPTLITRSRAASSIVVRYCVQSVTRESLKVLSSRPNRCNRRVEVTLDWRKRHL